MPFETGAFLKLRKPARTRRKSPAGACLFFADILFIIPAMSEILEKNSSLPPAFHLSHQGQAEALARLLWRAHHFMRDEVRRALIENNRDDLTAVAAQAEMDTLYGIDTIAEHSLLEFLQQHQTEAPPFVLVGEFETGEAIRFGAGAPQFRVLCDPIDGTRLLMFGKASGWILSAILPEKGDNSRLAETIFSLQTEIPLPKYSQTDTLWATVGGGAFQLRENLVTQQTIVKSLHAGHTSDLRHGFISFVKLFPRGKQLVAAIEEDFLREALRESAAEPASVFEDQHLSTAGQIYALIHGQNNLIVDFRPNLNHIWRGRAEPTVLCAHPYDLASWLIAQEAGVVIRDTRGEPLDGPTHATAEIGWIGFANAALAQRYQAVLLAVLRQHGMI